MATPGTRLRNIERQRQMIGDEDIRRQEAVTDARLREMEQQAYLDRLRMHNQTQEDIKRNRMGLNGIEPMLVDEYSRAWETRYPSGQTDPITGERIFLTPQEMGYKTEITVGDREGGAPAPLPQVMQPLQGGRRFLRDEYAELQEMMKRGNRTRTVDELAEIERIKGERQKEVASHASDLRGQEFSKKTQAKVPFEQARIMGDYAEPDQLSQDLGTSVGLALQSPPQAPARRIRDIYGRTQESGGGAQMLQLGEGERVLEEDDTGALIEDPDGQIFFLHYATGQRIPVDQG